MGSIRAISRIIVHLDIRLDVTCSSVRLKTGPERTRLFGVHLDDVYVSFDVVGIWRGDQFCKLSFEQRPSFGKRIFVNFHGVMHVFL